jgi:hypothetical protein
MESGELVVNGIAVVILAALSLLPFVNVAVGTIVGGSLAGPLGLCVGAVLALLITAAEVRFLQSDSSSAAPSADAGSALNAPGLSRVIDWRGARGARGRLAVERSAESQKRKAA